MRQLGNINSPNASLLHLLDIPDVPPQKPISEWMNIWLQGSVLAVGM